MNKILLEGSNVKELLQKFEQLIEKRIEQVNPPQTTNQLNLISRKEVASLLKISLPTLNEWTKSGLLKSYKIGTRILYKFDEVEKSLNQRNFAKYKRGGYYEA